MRLVKSSTYKHVSSWFQYRKRYEVTCDIALAVVALYGILFQYRKRYEVTCDSKTRLDAGRNFNVSIPQAV